MDKKEENKIRKKIRSVIKELFDNSTHYHEFPGAGSTFPYYDQFAPTKPQDIDTNINYFISLKPYDQIDIKKFPLKKFRKGMNHEKEENPDLGYFDIAKIVLTNLQNDKDYYSHPLTRKKDYTYFYSFNSFANNEDMYEFPFEEFKKGLKIEKGRNPKFNFLRIGEIVINNLEWDKYFYSNLIQAKYHKNSL